MQIRLSEGERGWCDQSFAHMARYNELQMNAARLYELVSAQARAGYWQAAVNVCFQFFGCLDRACKQCPTFALQPFRS
jgi:hypothetical protein